ncbi:MAG TPA: ABC transporter substrate binding protein, partial [Clostridia bacterium]|nr:ABC transporter substrate binding protein [Clostridia bacterium]
MKKMKKKTKGLIVLALVLVLAVGAYLVFQPKKQLSVGILQFVQHPALDAAREGFIKALTEEGYEDGKN